MERIDRLGWAAGLALNSYGVKIGVRVSEPDVLERIAALLPPGWKPARTPKVERLYSLRVGGQGTRAGVRRFNLLYADAEQVSRTMELGQALETLESDLQLYVAETARRRVFVHAGVVRWRGHAIVIPGRAFSGKSTLVMELIEAGATYYSDEYAVCDRQGRVHPYPKPPSLRSNGGVARPKGVAPRAGVKPIPVGVVLLTSYRPGARWRPRVLSQGRAVLEILRQTVSARMDPGVAIDTLQQVAAGALVLKGVRGEAREMVDSLVCRASEYICSREEVGSQ
ncbi:MAG: hypothetical protein ACE5HT_09505 [Gemmatimonadales bacterium]